MGFVKVQHGWLSAAKVWHLSDMLFGLLKLAYTFDQATKVRRGLRFLARVH